MLACDSKHSAAWHTGCTRPAGSDRLASGTPPPLARACVTMVIAAIRSRFSSSERLPLAACNNAPDVSCISADPRARGRPWATAVALASHMSRGSSSLRHRCAVYTAGLGNLHALRLVRLAARQLTAVAQPLQGPVSSARSCVPLRMRSITTGVSHLYRADPSSGHQAPILVRDAGGCDD